MKVVINRCYGGFGLSEKAYEFLGIKWDGYGFLHNTDKYKDITEAELRSDPDLVRCVETLGSEAASGNFAQLKVVEIPDDIDWYIDDYDGLETVEEMHRSWY